MLSRPLGRRRLPTAAPLCFLIIVAVGVTSCGSYTALPTDQILSEAWIQPGSWVRVETIGGEQFTDKVVRVSAQTLECRNHVVRFHEISSLERYHPIDFKVLALVAGALGYIGLVLAMR